MDQNQVKELLEPGKLKERLRTLLLGSGDVLGVDLGTYAIKLLWIGGPKGAQQVKVWGHLPIDVPADAPPEERVAKAISVLSAFIKEKKIDLTQAATSVSGNAVIVRYVKLPQLSKSELMKALPVEAEPFIPFDIKEVNLGAHILEQVVEEGMKKIETVLVAAKREVIQNRVDILKGAGLDPYIIDVDAFALEGVHELGPLAKETAGVLYLNVGHQVTNLSIVETGVTRVVRDIFIAGSTFTKAVQKGLGNEYDKAEAAKKQHGILLTPEEKEKALADGNQEALAVSQALGTVMRDLVSEMQRSVDFYLSQGTDRQIAQVVVSGGSAALKNFAPALSQELKTPVSVLDPFVLVKNSDVPAELAATFAVAAGLALRRPKDWL